MSILGKSRILILKATCSYPGLGPNPWCTQCVLYFYPGLKNFPLPCSPRGFLNFAFKPDGLSNHFQYFTILSYRPSLFRSFSCVRLFFELLYSTSSLSIILSIVIWCWPESFCCPLRSCCPSARGWSRSPVMWFYNNKLDCLLNCESKIQASFPHCFSFLIKSFSWFMLLKFFKENDS